MENISDCGKRVPYLLQFISNCIKCKKKHQQSTTINSVYSLYDHLICYHHQPPEVSLFQHVSTTHRQLKGGGCEHPGARHQRSVHGNHLSIHHVDAMDQGSLSTVHVPPWTEKNSDSKHPHQNHKNKWNGKNKETKNKKWYLPTL